MTSAHPRAVVTALGIVAGLVGTDLILIMLVLAARIPFIDRVVGQDLAMALHRPSASPPSTCCSVTASS